MVSKLILTVASMLGLGLANGPGLAASSTIPGTGAVTGTVTAPQPFSAAHVYLYNAEKRVTFMVYSAGGKYQAINLYPGEYEVRVARRGLVADPQKITVRAGETVNLDVALKDIGPAPQAGINGPSTVVAYPGRADHRRQGRRVRQGIRQGLPARSRPAGARAGLHVVPRHDLHLPEAVGSRRLGAPPLTR